MEHFPSKVDSWLRYTLILSALTSFAAAIWQLRLPEAEQLIWVTVLLLLAGGLCLWIMTTTYYRIYDDLLLVRSGPFRWRLRLSSITHVRRSINPIASPALSIDRLELGYGKGKFLLVSPLEPARFVQALQRCDSFRGEIDPSITSS